MYVLSNVSLHQFKNLSDNFVADFILFTFNKFGIAATHFSVLSRSLYLIGHLAVVIGLKLKL